MAISKKELIKKIDDWRKDKSIDLSDAYLEYLDSVLEKEGYDTFATDPDTGEELDDYTPEFEATQAEVLDDLGLSDDEINEIMGNSTSNDESLVIGGTDIYKEPFTEEQLAILRKDNAYNKLNADELNAARAEDIAKLKDIRDAKIKRARELLEGSAGDKPHDEELAGETTPEEDFMQRAAAGKVPATSGVLAGDLTPEEIEMIQMMRAGKKPKKNEGLAGETTPEENEMLNITNRLAKNLSKHRW